MLPVLSLDFFVPGGGLIKVAGKGSVAIEGAVRDADTGEILFEFRDREGDKAAPFTVKDFQRFAHAQVAFDEWAKQLVELLATPVTHMVDDSLPFTLSPL